MVPLMLRRAVSESNGSQRSRNLDWRSKAIGTHRR